MEALKEKIEKWLEPKLDELGCFPVDIRLLNGGTRIEVYIDDDEGVKISTCEQVSRYLQFMLDNEEGTPENYTLDVSSPGMENPFKVVRQYTKNIGKTVEVLLQNGEKKEGILKEVHEKDIIISVQKEIQKNLKPGQKPKYGEVKEETIAFTDIKSAKKKISF